MAQLNLLCPELCCLTFPSLVKAGQRDLCWLFGDKHHGEANFQSQDFAM